MRQLICENSCACAYIIFCVICKICSLLKISVISVISGSKKPLRKSAASAGERNHVPPRREKVNAE